MMQKICSSFWSGTGQRLRPWNSSKCHPRDRHSCPAIYHGVFLEFHGKSHGSDGGLPRLLSKIGSLPSTAEPGIGNGDMGNWVLAGEIVLGRLQDSFTTAEIGYWIDAESEDGESLRGVSQH